MGNTLATRVTDFPAHQARLLLASRSPRRREMLAHAGIAVIAEHPGFDDSVLEGGGVGGRAVGVSGCPEHWVAALAYLKARAGADLARVRDVEWALGADTACVLRSEGRVMTIGTPRDVDEARSMLRAMLPRPGEAEKRHDVLTGAAMVHARDSRRIIFVDTAQVCMGAVDDAALEAYLASGQWAGKAGAYNLADRQAAGWPLSVEGDPATVMGLPMRRLVPLMRQLAILAEDATPTAAVAAKTGEAAAGTRSTKGEARP